MIVPKLGVSKQMFDKGPMHKKPVGLFFARWLNFSNPQNKKVWKINSNFLLKINPMLVFRI